MSLIELQTQEQTGPGYINYFYEELNCKGALPTFTALTNTVASVRVTKRKLAVIKEKIISTQ